MDVNVIPDSCARNPAQVHTHIEAIGAHGLPQGCQSSIHEQHHLGERRRVQIFEAGDVVVRKADGTVANITTLPTANANDKDFVEYVLSAVEMAGSLTIAPSL